MMKILKRVFLAMFATTLMLSCTESKVDDADIPAASQDPEWEAGDVGESEIVLTLASLVDKINDPEVSYPCLWGNDSVVTLYDEEGDVVGDFEYSYATEIENVGVFASVEEGVTLTADSEYKVIYPASTESTYSAAMGVNLSTQTQDGDDNKDHLFSTKPMSAEFTYDPTTNPTVTLNHATSFIKVMVGLDANPTSLTLTDGANSYTVTMSDLEDMTTSVAVFTSYFAVEPVTTDASREVSITWNDGADDEELYKENLTTIYAAGELYAISPELPDMPQALTISPASFAALQFTHTWTTSDYVMVGENKFVYKDGDGLFYPETDTDRPLTDGTTYNVTYASTSTTLTELTQSGDSMDHLHGVMSMSGSFTYREATYLNPVENSVVMSYDNAIVVYDVESAAGAPTKVVLNDGDTDYTLNVSGTITGNDNCYTLYFAVAPTATESLVKLTTTVSGESTEFTTTSAYQFAANTIYNLTNSVVVRIGNAAALVEFSNRVNAGETTLNAVITATIEMSGVNFTPIGTSDNKYAGEFDGGNLQILKLNINTPEVSYVALFGYVGDGAYIHDIRLADATITGDEYVAGFIGSMTGGLIENCKTETNDKSTITGTNIVGGIVARVYSRSSTLSVVVRSCENVADVIGTGDDSGRSRTAGIVGNADSSFVIENCHNRGIINGADRTGGIVGFVYAYTKSMYSTIIGCSNSGNITGGADVGGVAGQLSESSSGTVEAIACYNTGNISGEDNVGGFAGSSATQSIDAIGCYSTGSVTSDDTSDPFIAYSKKSGEDTKGCYAVGTSAYATGVDSSSDIDASAMNSAINAYTVLSTFISGDSYSYDSSTPPGLIVTK